MVEPARFWDRAARKYAASAIGDPEAYAFTLDRTGSYLGPQMRALEIGCGTGSTALRLADRVATYKGADVSPRMIEIAQAKIAGTDNLSFQVNTARAALTTPEPYDAVLAFSILHLLPDLPEVLLAIHDKLGPQGVFISKTPCIAEPGIGMKRFAIRALLPVMQLFGKAPMARFLSFAALEAKITDAGFTIIETCSRPAMSRYIVARKA